MAKSAAARDAIVQTIADEVRAYCIAHADPVLVRKYAKFFKEGYDAYGIDHKDPSWESQNKEWAARLRAAGPTAYLDAGDILTRTGKYEEASAAILCAAAMRDRYTPAAFKRIGTWFEGGIRNWGHNDGICSLVLGPFLTDGVVDIDTLAEWRTSEFKYKRRAVPVAMLPLLDERADYGPMFDVIEPLMTDPERVVQQGVGWFLREAWKRQPKATEQFLMKHKETGARLIFQYATERMTPADRERFRRTKSARA
jgi:3-methyladenine DNA glycosylase AlkD